MIVWSGGECFAYLSDEIVAAQWHARQPRSVASARSASRREKILNFRPSEIVSGAILG